MPYFATDGNLGEPVYLYCIHCGAPNRFGPPFIDGERRECFCPHCDELIIFRCEERPDENTWYYWEEEAH